MPTTRTVSSGQPSSRPGPGAPAHVPPHNAGALLPTACVCAYNGRHFHLGDVIYYTTDGLGGCISARCGANGTIERGVHTCSPTTPTPQTTFSFSTSLPGKADMGVPLRAVPHPRPESGRSRDPAERMSLGRSPCNQEGPAFSRPLAGLMPLSCFQG